MTDLQLLDNVPVITRPFLKWAGGKRRLLTQYQPHFPPRAAVRCYHEPFLGGGAVYFATQYDNSILADVNPDLVEAYQVVRDDVEALIEALTVHRNDETYFYQMRNDVDPAALDPVGRVSRLIFLNRTCYNGLYRVNQSGRFNVPFGRYKQPRICDPPLLRACSQALRKATLQVADFRTSCAKVQAGDLVYFDPPYAPASSTARFTSYAKDGFGEAEQRALADCYHDLHQRGALLMLSNSATELVHALYQGHGYRLLPIEAARAINSNPSGRGPVQELLIVNFSPADLS